MFGASSPANGQRICRHSARGKTNIGNHQLRQALKEPQHAVPNVLSKDLDDGEYDDPYGHEVDDDGSDSGAAAVPRTTKTSNSRGSPKSSDAVGVDLNTVDFTSLDSASVHKVLEHCADHHPAPCDTKMRSKDDANTNSLLGYEELSNKQDTVSSQSCHGRLLWSGDTATESPEGFRRRRQRRFSASGVLTNPSVGATHATTLPCGMNPMRQRRRFSAGGSAVPASSLTTTATTTSNDTDTVVAALSGYPARRQRRRASVSGSLTASAINASIMTDAREGIVVPMIMEKPRPLRRKAAPSCQPKKEDRFNDLDDEDSDSDDEWAN